MPELHTFGPIPLDPAARYVRADLELYGINTFRPSYEAHIFLNDPKLTKRNGALTRSAPPTMASGTVQTATESALIRPRPSPLWARLAAPGRERPSHPEDERAPARIGGQPPDSIGEAPRAGPRQPLHREEDGGGSFGRSQFTRIVPFRHDAGRVRSSKS